MKRYVVGAVLGAILAAAGGAVAAGPSILAALPLGSCTAISNTSIANGASETVLAANVGRKKMCIVAASGNTAAVHVKFGATAATSDMPLAAGSSICESIEGGYVYTSVVDAIAASGTQTIGGFECQ